MATFEERFSQLAFSALRQKCPQLTSRQVAFQLVDRDEDAERAFGVTIIPFKDLTILVPVIFNRGKLKGLNLAWLVEYNLMFPNKDNLLLFLEQKGQSLLGKLWPKETEESQAQGPSDVSTWGFRQDQVMSMKTSGDPRIVKFASEVQRRFDGEPFNLVELIKKGGDAMVVAFSALASEDADFLNTMLQRLGARGVYDLVNQARVKVAAATQKVNLDPEERPRLELVTDISKARNAKERERILQNGFFIRDNREEADRSPVFKSTLGNGTYVEINRPGFYQALTSEGKLCDVIVVNELSGDNRLVVIDVDSKATCSAEQNSDAVSVAEDKLLSDITERVYPIGVEANREVRERILRKLRSWTSAAKTAFSAARPESTTFFIVDPDTCEMVRSFRYVKASVTIIGDAVQVEGAKFVFGSRRKGIVKIDDTYFISKDAVMMTQGEEPVKLHLATWATLDRMLYKRAGALPLVLQKRPQSSELVLESPLLHKKAFGPPADMAFHLADEYGMDAGLAAQLVRESLKRPTPIKFHVKVAANTSPMRISLRSPKDKDGDERTLPTLPMVTEKEIEKVINNPGDKFKQLSQEVVRAAQTGIKEVVDVATLKRLIDIADIAEVRTDFLRDIIRGMDRIGRILFMLYWHRDLFIERYGEEDFGKLENAMEDIFPQLGDLVLYLQERRLSDPQMAENLLGNLTEDLSEAVGTVA